MEPRWTSSVKDAVGTAYAASSRIWFTCSHGILNEMYHPTIDRPQVRDMEFLVTDGETFVHEEKRDLVTTFEYIDPEALGVRYVNRDPEGRYTLTKEIICDPHHGVVLTHVRLEGHEDLVPRLKVYALLAPHLDGGGAGNSARALDMAGHKVLLAWKNQWSLAMAASCGFSKRELRICGRKRRLAGPDGKLRDGLGVWLGNERQRCGDGRAGSLGPGGGERIRVYAGTRGRRGDTHGGAEDHHLTFCAV